MIGPHYQRLAEAERQITGKQMLERVQSHTDNPLTMVIDKLKRQFTEYETAYTEDITHHQISSVDRLLSFDGKLGPILARIEKENNLLRREIGVLESQLSNSVGICEHLVQENTQLKEALIEKNSDISKIIETVARNESQSRDELEEKIGLLEQENSILIQHLEEVKKKHQEYQGVFEAKQEQIKRWERKWTETKKQLSEAVNRERDITRKLAISEQLLFEEKEKKEVLQNQKHLALIENADLKAKVDMFEQMKSNFDVEALKRSIENEYLQIIEEHRAMKSERASLTREADKNRAERERLAEVLADVEKKFNKVLSEYELSNNLVNEQKSKNQTLISTIKKLEAKMDEMKGENTQYKIEIESMRSASHSREKSLESEVDQLRRQLYDKSAEAEKRMREIKSKTEQLLDAKDLEINNLQSTINELRRLSDR